MTMILSKVVGWFVNKALVILASLCAILGIYSLTSHYIHKARVATLNLKIQEQQQAIDGFIAAAKLHEQKLADAITLANSEYKATKKEIEALEAGPMPKTAEEARKWALDALNGGRK